MESLTFVLFVPVSFLAKMGTIRMIYYPFPKAHVIVMMMEVRLKKKLVVLRMSISYMNCITAKRMIYSI
jgi:hypothetical protein